MPVVESLHRLSHDASTFMLRCVNRGADRAGYDFAMTIAYVTHADCALHRMGEHHPEDPRRLGFVNDRLLTSGLAMAVLQYDAPEVTREQVLRAHDAEYFDWLCRAAPEEGLRWVDEDTALGPASLESILRAAGAAVLGVDLVMSGRASQAFCAVRPPGHHATRSRAMGFCFLNNVAIGARHALAIHGVERVAIADFDVHHGNGTEEIVAGDTRVLFLSTFEHPSYPFSGAPGSASNVVNVPLPAGTGSVAFRDAVRQRWLPALHHFAPELVMVSAGFDGHQADIMAQFELRDDDYAWVTSELLGVARQHARGRLVSCLEGGYHLHALARSVEAHLRALLD
jgi:acetoin utilization deacetylase AcuC-like enzyme